MELGEKAKRCRYRIREAEHGFVEARPTLTDVENGGRSHPVFTDYRPSWDIGHRKASGELALNDAAITLEDAPSIPPGGTGLVRLHPLSPEVWTDVKSGTEIAMHEGRRVVGNAGVLRVTICGR